MARRLFIAGNWKLHKGPEEAGALASQLAAKLPTDGAIDIAVFPPFISIPAALRALQGAAVDVGGQDLFAQSEGAFTSAVSGPMLRQAGCARVLVGHSERRSLFGDTDADVSAKLRAALDAGLLPILCVGETLEQRDAGAHVEVVQAQIDAALAGLAPDQLSGITLAYEPVWAIGTGRTASPDQAQAMHAAIRAGLAARFPAFVAQETRIQYGGSVKPANAAELLAQPDIDGALVGGASLDADAFARIVEAAETVSR